MEYQVGQQIGSYRLLSMLGQGGFAEVYLGEHVYLGSNAAIKILSTRLSGKSQDNFLAEARFLAKFDHPHIVRILDFGMQDEAPFLVMECALNGSLRQRYPKETKVPLDAIVAYVQQVSDALQYAHDQRLIHRDIKPENMLIGKHNEILLSDFGIALQSSSSSNQALQEVAGTVPYMAPELFQGKPRPASDQYALGIVVYEWLSGAYPFRGSLIEVASQHMFVDPPSLRDKNPAILPEVEHVVMTALAKDPKQRFANMYAFANALGQAARLPLQPQTQSNQGVLPTLLIAPLSSAFSGSPQWSQVVKKPVVEAAQERKVLTHLEQGVLPPGETEIATEIINQPAWHSSPTVADLLGANIFSGKQVSLSREQKLIAANVPILSQFQKSSLSRRAVLAGLTALGLVGAIGGSGMWLNHMLDTAQSSPNHFGSLHPVSSAGTMFGMNAQHTRVVPNEYILSTANVNRLTLLWTTHLGGAISMSSSVIAYGIIYVGSTNSHVYAVQASSGNIVWKLMTDNEIFSSPAVADGVVYIGSNDHSIYALKAPSGEIFWKVVTGDSVPCSPVVIDGVVYIGSSDSNFYAIDAVSGHLLWKAQTDGGITSSPAVVDGVIYFGSFDKYVYALKVSNGQVIWKTLTEGGVFSSPSVANGVVYIGGQDTLIYALNASTGSVLWRVKTGDFVNSSPAVLNNTIYIGSKDAHLYAINHNGTVLWKTRVASEIASSPAIANGVIYVGSWDHNLYAFDLSNGNILWHYQTLDGIESSPAVSNGIVYVGSRDGRLYAFSLPKS